ncbi:MAG TPA: DMT family transporter [Geminicoccus sp.]|jgi:drug/metabolite transporter (DMT)-like permease|uniref:DMT family transporter n=1 Tax=Geminicoccus sp. TaxID=2024832 RepID=UPI002E366D5C|nr:DMT family transporter [Geminicoccus sp.]HEX2529078.1 DMT family transporter [Geminicoccus sp.]
MDSRPVLWGNLAGIANNLLWATTIPVTEMLLATWPPFVLAAGRLMTAALGILLLFPLLRRKLDLKSIPWRSVAKLGGLYMAPSVVLMVWGQDLSDTVAAAVVLTTMPLVSALMGFVQGTERLRLTLLLGVLLAMLGGTIAAGTFDEGAPDFRGGEIIVLGSITLWALFSRATVRELGGHDSLAQSFVTVGTAGVVLSLFSTGLVGGGLVPPITPTVREILLLLWMGCIGVGMSLPLWLLSARLLGVTVASMHQNLLPFYVMALAVLLGQGRIEADMLAGAALVSLGALIAQVPWDRLRRRPAPQTMPNR